VFLKKLRKRVQISGYMHKFQDLTPISGHFRTNFKISGISGQRPGLNKPTVLSTHCCYILQVNFSTSHGFAIAITFLSNTHVCVCLSFSGSSGSSPDSCLTSLHKASGTLISSINSISIIKPTPNPIYIPL